MVLATESAWRSLDQEPQLDRAIWPHDLVKAVAPRVSTSPSVQQKLRGWMRQRHELQPLAASLMHLAGIKWEWPSPKLFRKFRWRVNLTDAILDGAEFPRAAMRGFMLDRASLAHSDLSDARLIRATANSTNFDHADLQRANVTKLLALHASFIKANLSGVSGVKADFTHANLTSANLQGAQLDQSIFVTANLTGAHLINAVLKKCSFNLATLEDADFRFANLEGANFSSTDLTTADFRNAIFRSAALVRCHLEGMELPEADFESAKLVEAIMTAAIMPGANLQGANLTGARLAEINWESANLRCADLTGATFHMGSSRSGLVGSTIPMEGSKTGFYRDDWSERDFKAPEEIRKANLRGADLRGACIEKVDFYLVDLRDALYDARQAIVFRRTGAIL